MSSIIKNNQRKIYNQRVLIQKSSKSEIVVYETLQIVFNRSIFLVYFNLDKILFINVDAFKKLKFNIVIYHTKNDDKYRNDKLLIVKNDMKFILFFSKYLINVENCYWFTKLKIVDLIWFVRRIKHMIETFVKSSIIIYTNHFVIVFIIQQIKLSLSSINKLNFRLIRVSIYLFQFFLNIKYKSNNQHIVSNILSRLFIDTLKFVVNSFVFDNVYQIDVY